MNAREIGILLIGIMLGVLPGYLIANAMERHTRESQVSVGATDESNESVPSASVKGIILVPKSAGECAVLISQATTNSGANILYDYCDKNVSGFMD